MAGEWGVARNGKNRRVKTILHFFSGTGNTARAVQAVAARLAVAGHEVVLQPIDGHTASPAGIPDLTLLAFPIWSWAAPHFVLDYVRRLPKAKGARAAVLATCGGFGAQGVEEVERGLRRRGYQVSASGEAAYPDNWTLAVNPPTGPELEKALAQGDARVQKFADNLLSDHPMTFRCAFIHKLWSWPIAMLFRSFGRRFMGKFFVADDRCTSCGLCAVNCPVQAIRMEGTPSRPRWNASCAGCYRCINLCPAQAIQISVPLLTIHLGLNLAVTVAWFFWIGWIHRQLPPLPGLFAWCLTTLVALAVYAVVAMLQLTAVDALVHWFATQTPLRRFFLRNYTKSFGRYRASGFHVEAKGAKS
jgi:Pyruvate/2-oxoacid:ferredoxin oxidoreductase delta subunit